MKKGILIDLGALCIMVAIAMNQWMPFVALGVILMVLGCDTFDSKEKD